MEEGLETANQDAPQQTVPYLLVRKKYNQAALPADSPLEVSSETIYKGSTQADSSLQVGSETL